MSPLVYIVMFGWIPAVSILFRWLPPQRNRCQLSAWLFLPQVEFTQVSTTPKCRRLCFNVLLAAIVFDIKRFSSFKPSWLDLPMLVWCLCPYASSISNDGLVRWDISRYCANGDLGLPYFLGRLYLNDLDGLRKLAIGIASAGCSTFLSACLNS